MFRYQTKLIIKHRYIVAGSLSNHLTGTTVGKLVIAAFRWGGQATNKVTNTQKQTNTKTTKLDNKQTFAEINTTVKSLFSTRVQ